MENIGDLKGPVILLLSVFGAVAVLGTVAQRSQKLIEEHTAGTTPVGVTPNSTGQITEVDTPSFHDIIVETPELLLGYGHMEGLSEALFLEGPR